MLYTFLIAFSLISTKKNTQIRNSIESQAAFLDNKQNLKTATLLVKINHVTQNKASTPYTKLTSNHKLIKLWNT